MCTSQAAITVVGKFAKISLEKSIVIWQKHSISNESKFNALGIGRGKIRKITSKGNRIPKFHQRRTLLRE
jgi:hypothetical protein